MEKEARNKLIRILFAGILLLAAFLLPVDGIWKTLLFLSPWLVAGADVLWEAVEKILHGELFDEEFLMAVATIGAIAIREYPEAAAVMILYQIGELLQDMAVDKSRDSIADLMNLKPETVCVLRNGTETVCKPEEAAVGEIIVVRPGERVPLDGVIVAGETSFDLSALTGESRPVRAGVSDEVKSGGVNQSGVIRLRTTRPYGESTVARILDLVENSAEKKAKTENFITRFSRIYTPMVVGLAVIIAVIPPLFGSDWSEWLRRALTFLMVSCPCALVISVPLAFFGGVGGAAKDGILVKGAGIFETLSKIDTVVFDKTGTLTEGKFEVTAIHPQEMSEAALLDIAAAAESFSTHPAADSIRRAHGGHIDRSRIGEVKELAGMGVEAVIDGDVTWVGNDKLMAARGIDMRPCHLSGTVVHIARAGEYLGHIVVSDVVKEDAAQAVAALKRCGVKKTVMLTGDSAAVAEAVGTALGIDEVFAGLLPEDKVGKVENYLETGHTAAFVGDGINDAPVIMRADVGFAMGALGSDAAVEAADVVLSDDRPSKIAEAIRIARRTLRIARENIFFALSAKLVVMILGLFGAVSLWFAVFMDVGVALLATLNSLRAMKTR